ncbi:RNA polymerase sigma factor [Roseivirga misakiensis]|uniref:RNA polymerase subunit sigma-70 n=1 Tax=Roseivirga misakiensis TaxID=1563681 RepID=A0A1E5T212_9BACT|nr:RNA polymerase sigma factor [Roseivirga misakiensis]OEK05401.1 RNA polymerase subunit sigma-70 [Roseivirga misakiensis]
MKEQQQNEVFNDWLQKHKGILFKVVRAYGANLEDQEDLFQEIAVQVWRSVPKFRNDCAVSTWMYRIALNTAIKWSSKERKYQEGREDIAKAHILTEQSEFKDERLGWLYEQIARLDNVDRSLCLLLLDGFSYKEMAKIVGISESYVGVRINRIKKHLTQQSEKVS